MALEELTTTVSKLTFNFFGSESEKKMGKFLFDEKTEWATSRELHGLAALTFNERECAGVMGVIEKALNPKENTWKTLLKAVKLLHHFVLYGAERCVDHAWDHQRRVDNLRRYNSAIHGRTGTLSGGGTDFGAPVRKAAAELDDLLKNSDAIREAREEGRTPDALLPMGAADDYSAPVQPKGIDLGIDDAFGVIPEGSVGAKFDLEQVPGMYDGRPDRYFDNTADPRKRTQGVEDSDYTRQALAVDLLDLDIGEAQPSSVPESQDLVRATKEAALQQQLLAQQQQLEQLKILMLGKAQQQGGGNAGAAGGGGVGGGGDGGGGGGMRSLPGVAGGGGSSSMGGGKPDKVMEAFGSSGLGDAGGGRGLGAGGVMQQQLGIGMGTGIAAATTTQTQPGGGGGGGGGVMRPGQLGVNGAVKGMGSAAGGGGDGGGGLGHGGFGNLGLMGAGAGGASPLQGQQQQQQGQQQQQQQQQQQLWWRQQQLAQKQAAAAAGGGMGSGGGGVGGAGGTGVLQRGIGAGGGAGQQHGMVISMGGTIGQQGAQSGGGSGLSAEQQQQLQYLQQLQQRQQQQQQQLQQQQQHRSFPGQG